MDNVGRVFEVGDEGAIIYDGEKVGLHKEFFINKMAYQHMKPKTSATWKKKKVGDFEKSVVITANEQSDYFKVLYSAINDLGICDKEKLVHWSRYDEVLGRQDEQQKR